MAWIQRSAQRKKIGRKVANALGNYVFFEHRILRVGPGFHNLGRGANHQMRDQLHFGGRAAADFPQIIEEHAVGIPIRAAGNV